MGGHLRPGWRDQGKRGREAGGGGGQCRCRAYIHGGREVRTRRNRSTDRGLRPEKDAATLQNARITRSMAPV